ncbi:unknown [Rockfish nackednavirus]|nr:unknown [Rockfish nackednavirus]
MYISVWTRAYLNILVGLNHEDLDKKLDELHAQGIKFSPAEERLIEDLRIKVRKEAEEAIRKEEQFKGWKPPEIKEPEVDEL